MLSVIVTVDFARRPLDLLRKLWRMSRGLRPELELVFAHHNRNAPYDRLLPLLCGRQARIVSVTSHAADDAVICNARLRNVGVSQATHQTIALVDADLWLDQTLLLSEARELSEQQPFVILPCYYLTRFGSRRFFRKGAQWIARKCQQADKRYLQLLASPSSAMVLSKRDYQALGGFDEQYRGHGYEDFDFMLRLAARYGQLDLQQDLLTDQPYTAPILAQGFRAQLSRLSLGKLLAGKVMFHFHHAANRKTDSYYQARQRNRQRFISKMASCFPELPASSDRQSEAKQRHSHSLVGLLHSLTDSPEAFPVLFDCRSPNAGKIETYKQRLRYITGR